MQVFQFWLYVGSLIVLFYIQVCLCGLRQHPGSSGSLTTEDRSESADLCDTLNFNPSQVHMYMYSEPKMKTNIFISI